MNGEPQIKWEVTSDRVYKMSPIFYFLYSVTGRSGGETENCPAGSAACLLHEGQVYDVGHPKEQLKLHDNDRFVIFVVVLL